MKKQEKKIKKLTLMKETLLDLEQVTGGSQYNDTVYRPQYSDYYYCSRQCPVYA